MYKIPNYEYLTMVPNITKIESDAGLEELDSLGAEGWELIKVLDYSGRLTLIFKRERGI